MVEAAVDHWGRLDFLDNNVGIGSRGSVVDEKVEQYRRVMQVNVETIFLLSKYAIPAMIKTAKGGAIVNISSISGKVGLIGQTNYSAAKAGIVGLTKAAAKEVAHLGVRINAIQPGLIRSAMTEAMPQRIWDAKLAEIPMARAGEPTEVANVALFLASDLSSYMTGTVLEVTGGRHI
jgi:3-oxoacyl-[acyl-carrier protein] reductase